MKNQFELGSEKSEKHSEILREGEIIKIKATGEKKEDSLPLLYVPGWGETSKSTGDFLSDLASDRDVISFNQPREERIDKKTVEMYKDKGFSNLQLQKALATLETIEKTGNKKVDAIGSSEGGMILVMAAYLEPGKFRNIVLVEPAGIIGKDSLLKLVKRFGIDHPRQNKVRPREQQEKMDVVKKDFRSFWKKNLLQSIKEVSQMSKVDIINLIRRLKESGISISIVSNVGSKVFSSDKIQKEVGKRLKNSNTGKTIVDGFYSVRSRRQKDGGTGKLTEYNDSTMETYNGGHVDIRYDKHFQAQIKVILDQLIDRGNKKEY